MPNAIWVPSALIDGEMERPFPLTPAAFRLTTAVRLTAASRTRTWSVATTVPAPPMKPGVEDTNATYRPSGVIDGANDATPVSGVVVPSLALTSMSAAGSPAARVGSHRYTWATVFPGATAEMATRWVRDSSPSDAVNA